MKQRTQVIVLIVLMVIAAGIFGAQYWPSGSGKSGSASLFSAYQRLNFPNPEIHWPIIDARRKAEYKQIGCNLFTTCATQTPEEVKKIEEQRKKEIEDARNVPPSPTPDPVLPADMKFFGYGTVPNGTPRRAFLSYQDDVLIVSEGDTLIGRFRILKINNATLEFEELSSGRRGQKVIEDQGPTA
jgi:hypothetical protein